VKVEVDERREPNAGQKKARKGRKKKEKIEKKKNKKEKRKDEPCVWPLRPSLAPLCFVKLEA